MSSQSSAKSAPRRMWRAKQLDKYRQDENARLLGEGTYGSVFFGRDPVTKEQVALKQIKNITGPHGFPTIALREIDVLRQINLQPHPNIIHLKDVVSTHVYDLSTDETQIHGSQGSSNAQESTGTGTGKLCAPRSVFLVLEFMDHDLRGLMDHYMVERERAHVFFRAERIKQYMKAILNGLHGVHRLGFIHRDIKSANVAVSSQGVCKLIDFGLAKRYTPGMVMRKGMVTLWYRAPEILLGSCEYGLAVDVWSVGCVFGELLGAGHILFRAGVERQLMVHLFGTCGHPRDHDWPEAEKLSDYSTFQAVWKQLKYSKDPVQAPPISFVGRADANGRYVSASPASDSQPREVKLRTRKPHFRMPALRKRLAQAGVADELALDLLEGLLALNPRHRLTAAEALDHPYFHTAPMPWTHRTHQKLTDTGQYCDPKQSGEVLRRALDWDGTMAKARAAAAAAAAAPAPKVGAKRGLMRSILQKRTERGGGLLSGVQATKRINAQDTPEIEEAPEFDYGF